MLPYTVSKKVVISGKHVEIYEFEKPYYVGFPAYSKPRTGWRIEKTKPNQKEMRDDNVKRTKKRLKRLVNSNPTLLKFFTLTFADSVKDFKTANHEFRIFIKRVKRKYPLFKYVAVPEFQDKTRGGVIHYHMLCNLPYMPVSGLEELHQLWGQGWIDLRRIDKVENLGAYMAKYLGKQNFDNRLFGVKNFLLQWIYCSRELSKKLKK